jgi:hypothetical protein
MAGHTVRSLQRPRFPSIGLRTAGLEPKSGARTQNAVIPKRDSIQSQYQRMRMEVGPPRYYYMAPGLNTE